MKAALVIAVAGVWTGCGTGGERRPGPADAAPSEAASSQAVPAEAKPAAFRIESLPAGVGEPAFLAEARALPAWTAVLERGRLLARRGERGAAWGRIVSVSARPWLVDEGEGLAIRLAAAPDGVDLPPLRDGQRVVAFGAWAASAERRWVWQVERLVELPPAEKEAPPLLHPGRPLAELPAAPEDALLPSERTKSGMMRFAVLARPVKPGDGWAIGDTARGPPAALLVLPGEAPIRGGLDYLSSDERWPLELGVWYAVPAVAPNKPPRAGELPVLRARLAPARIPAPPAPAPPTPRRAAKRR